MDFQTSGGDHLRFKNEEFSVSYRKILGSASESSKEVTECNEKEFIEANQLRYSKNMSLSSKKKPGIFQTVVDDIEEFSGFDCNDIESFYHDSKILNKLLDEAEMMNNLSLKRHKTSMVLWKTTDNFVEEVDDNTTDSDDHTATIESNTSDSALNKPSCKIDNFEDNASMYYHPVRKNKGSRVVSPSTVTRQKVSVDVTNPLYKEPFNHGWKRELVYRAGTSENQTRRMADIYYYTPEGKKVRSYREVIEFLTASELTIDNFTFFKEPLGVNDPNKEIIRDAKKTKDYLNSKFAVSQLKKSGTFPAKKLFNKKDTEVCTPETESITVTKSSKPAATFKVKVPTKKAASKKLEAEDESCPPVATVTTIKEVSAPPGKSIVTRKIQQLEKSFLLKPMKTAKIKVQEPCSIRCSKDVGFIPSVQCSVCLCLYHPECTNMIVKSFDFVCKNCRVKTSELLQNQSDSTLVPPPLIPISMLNVQKGSSSNQMGFLPKLQRITKSEFSSVLKTCSSTIPQLRYTDEKKPSYFSEKVFWHDNNYVFHRSQNIALLSGKRFIVIPKNAVADQPVTIVRNKVLTNELPSVRKDLNPSHLVKAMKNQHSFVSQSKFLIDDTFKTIVNKLNQLTEHSEKTVLRNVNLRNTLYQNLLMKLNDHLSSTNMSSVGLNWDHSSIESRKILFNTFSTFLHNNYSAKMDQGTLVQSKPSFKYYRKRQTIPEFDHRQNLMVTVCAGYHALSRIFQYLTVKELLRAARVCRMWRDLAAHPLLWKTVRMKNSQVTDWEGSATTLKNRGTEHLDLRKMLIVDEADATWKKFVTAIPNVTSLVKLELCRCPAVIVEEIMKKCPQLLVLSAMSIECDTFDLQFAGNLNYCNELRLKAVSGMSLLGDLTPLLSLSKITHLSLTSVKDLGRKKIDVLQSLQRLEALELGECSDFSDQFGTIVLTKLKKLEKLRLEKGQGTCCTFDILEGISKMQNLTQLELVNFDVKNGFDKYLAACKNLKRLLIIPTYVSQSATSNNMILGGVTQLSNNLTHFVWGVTQELLKVTLLFVDQCNQMSKQITGDSIPVLKPVPCLELIEDLVGERNCSKGHEEKSSSSNPQVEILPLPHLQKLLLTALPKTRVKILKIPFYATWRQSISDSTSQ